MCVSKRSFYLDVCLIIEPVHHMSEPSTLNATVFHDALLLSIYLSERVYCSFVPKLLLSQA